MLTSAGHCHGPPEPRQRVALARAEPSTLVPRAAAHRLSIAPSLQLCACRCLYFVGHSHLPQEARLSVHGFRLRMDSTYGSCNGPARQSHIRSYAPFSDKVRAAMAADDWAAASTLAECDALNSVTPMQVRNWPTSVRPFGEPSRRKVAAMLASAWITMALLSSTSSDCVKSIGQMYVDKMMSASFRSDGGSQRTNPGGRPRALIVYQL